MTLSSRASENSVGRSILVIIWHLLSAPETHFHDLGPAFSDTRGNDACTKRTHVRQLEALGHRVTIR